MSIPATINAALRDQAAIHMIYIGAETVSMRLIEPFKWIRGNQILAYDFGRGEMRQFKADMIYRAVQLPPEKVFLPYQIIERGYEQ